MRKREEREDIDLVYHACSAFRLYPGPHCLPTKKAKPGSLTLIYNELSV
jgi:hypothetical protein